MSSADWFEFRAYMRTHTYPIVDRATSFQLEAHARNLLDEIETAETAWGAVIAALAVGDIPSIRAVWYHLDVFLGAASRVSHTLWPSSGYATRGQLLRQHFAIPDDSPLRQRAIRNAYEHFDERVDDFLATDPRIIADRNIGTKAGLIVIDGAEPPYLRHLDPATMTASFLGDVVDLMTLFSALDALPGQMYGITEALDLMLDARDIPRRVSASASTT